MKSITCPNCQKPAGLMIRINPKGETGIFWCVACASSIGIDLYKGTVEYKVLSDTSTTLENSPLPKPKLSK